MRKLKNLFENFFFLSKQEKVPKLMQKRKKTPVSEWKLAPGLSVSEITLFATFWRFFNIFNDK